ncbi:MAG: hypothetical protein ACPGTP_09250, partial [Bacteroidia bacterium]
GDIDVGRDLPSMLSGMGMKISTRPMAKFATPSQLTWQWPKSFYEVYFPKLAEMGYMTPLEVEHAFTDFQKLEKIESAHLFCPTLIEIIAEKV